MAIQVTREEQQAILDQMAKVAAAQDDQGVKNVALAGTQETLAVATAARDEAQAAATTAADAVAAETQALVAVCMAAFQDDTPA